MTRGGDGRRGRRAAERGRDLAGQARARGGVPAPARSGARRHAARGDLHQRGAAPGPADPSRFMLYETWADRTDLVECRCSAPTAAPTRPACRNSCASRAGPRCGGRCVETSRSLRARATDPPRPRQRSVRSAAVGSFGSGGFVRQRWVRSAAVGSFGSGGFYFQAGDYHPTIIHAELSSLSMLISQPRQTATVWIDQKNADPFPDWRVSGHILGLTSNQAAAICVRCGGRAQPGQAASVRSTEKVALRSEGSLS